MTKGVAVRAGYRVQHGAGVAPGREERMMRRLRGLLQEWADWCRSYRPRLGFPGGSVCESGDATRTASKTFEDLCADCDRTINRTVEAAIDDLTPAQRAAVYRCYEVAAVFRFPRDNYAEQLDQAHAALCVTLPKRGVMLDF